MTEGEKPEPGEVPDQQEIPTGIDFVDPIKRDPDDPEQAMPGLDPMLPPVPPD